MTKLSVSLPDDIYKAVLSTIPEGPPFSQGLTALIRKALGLADDPQHPIVIGNTTGITEVTPEIRMLLQSMLREEIKTALDNQKIPEDDIEICPSPREQENINDEWISQSDIVRMLPDTILIHTRKSKVSKAVAAGKLVNNGMRKSECRIQKKSAEAWITEVTKYKVSAHRKK